MACNFIHAYKDATTCKLTMAGTGDRVYFFDKDAWLAKIEAAGLSGFPTPGYQGVYGYDASGAKDEDAVAKLNQLSGLLFAVDIKTDSGQVTSEKTAENEASSQVGTFVVADNIENWNETAHALAFMDYGCIIPVIGGGYYMVMSPYKKPTLEDNYDSGTTYDSDHGFTATVTCSPSEYGVTYLPDGNANGVSEDKLDTTITDGDKDDTTACTLQVA